MIAAEHLTDQVCSSFEIETKPLQKNYKFDFFGANLFQKLWNYLPDWISWPKSCTFRQIWATMKYVELFLERIIDCWQTLTESQARNSLYSINTIVLANWVINAIPLEIVIAQVVGRIKCLIWYVWYADNHTQHYRQDYYNYATQLPRGFMSHL